MTYSTMLKHLRIDLLPTDHNHPSLLPVSGSWDGLRHAFRDLECPVGGLGGFRIPCGGEKGLNIAHKCLEVICSGGAHIEHVVGRTGWY